MSGIYGIIDFGGGAVCKETLNKIESIMVHRGADGKTQWVNNNIGLGHLKLKITPESEFEQLPLLYKQWVITADARLDNRDELNAHLYISEQEQSITPDSTYIVKAYEKWGRDCVKYLIGDFAFAIWDITEKNLFCARDHLGLKPFFYSKIDNKLLFASEIKPILEQSGFNYDLNYNKVGDSIYFIQDFDNPQETIFNGVYRLLPAHFFLHRNESEILQNRYWQLEKKNTIVINNEDEYPIHLKALTIKAIESRLRTKYPKGISLSGGLDSSAVACISAGILSKNSEKLYAVAAILPEKYNGIEYDEKSYIDSVVKQEKNIHLDYISSDNGDFLADGKEFINKTSQISGIFYTIDKSIRTKLCENNVRLKLNGFAGDMAASHSDSLVLLNLLIEMKLKKFFYLSKKQAEIEKINFTQLVAQKIVKPLALSLPCLVKLINLLRKKNIKTYKKKYIVSDFYNINIYYKLKKTTKSEFNFFLSMKQILEGCFIDFEYFNLVSSLNSIEEVTPLADIRIIEYIYNLPIDAFLFKGEKRNLWKTAMFEFLPSFVHKRKDKGAFYPNYWSTLIKRRHEITSYLINQKHNVKNIFCIDEIISDIDKITLHKVNLYDIGWIIRLIQFFEYLKLKNGKDCKKAMEKAGDFN